MSNTRKGRSRRNRTAVAVKGGAAQGPKKIQFDSPQDFDIARKHIEKNFVRLGALDTDAVTKYIDSLSPALQNRLLKHYIGKMWSWFNGL